MSDNGAIERPGRVDPPSSNPASGNFKDYIGDDGILRTLSPTGSVIVHNGSSAITTHEATPDPHPQYLLESEVGTSVAPLVAGEIPASYLPSYVDDVLEYANLVAFPGTGETSKIYVDKATGKIYRWTGSIYVEISPSPGSTDAVPEGSINLYFTTGRASAAAPVQSVASKTGYVTLNKADVGLSNVDNTADVDKPVSTAQSSAIASAISVHEAASDPHPGYQLKDGDLTALSNLASTGMVTRTASDTYTTRTITAGTGVSVTNGSGVSANPSVALANTTVTAGSYTIPTITVNAQGQLTAASSTTLTKSDVGLGNVDNTSDANKPVSTAQAAAIAAAQAASQPLDADLTSVAGLSTTGQVTRTAANTFTTRTLTAGTGLSVTNGDGVSGNPTVGLANTTVTAGSYGSGTAVPVLSVNAQGQITAASTSALSLPNSGVTAGTYGSVNENQVLTINAQGQVTAASTVPITSATLTGLTTGTDATITATDTILQALANLQAQINVWQESITTATLATTSSTVNTSLTDLAFNVVAGQTYHFEYNFIFRSAATTTGIKFQLDTAGAAGTLAATVQIPTAAAGVSSVYTGYLTTFTDFVRTLNTPLANTNYMAQLNGQFICTTSGTITPGFCSEINASQVQVLSGSVGLIRAF